MNTQAIKLNSFLKSLAIAGVFGLSFVLSSQAQAAPQLQVKNDTHATYSAGTPPNNFAASVRAEPGDTLQFQMFGNFTAASTYTVVLPNDLTYAATVSSNPAASVSASGQTITWTFTTSSTEVIKFTATVAAGPNLSASHNLSVNFTTDTAATSNSATITTGPIVTAVTPGSGGDITATEITIIGHGFTGTTAVALSDGTAIDISTATITDTSISGSSVRATVPHALGAYWVLVTVTSSGNTLTTEANSSESASFTYTESTEPIMSSADSYTHSTGILSLTFNETIDVSATDLSKITLYDAAAGGTLSQVLTGAAVSTTASTTVTITLTQTQKNAVSAAGVSAGNLYIQIAGSGIFDASNNALAAQDARTAITAWTKDSVQPTAALSYTQNSLSTTLVKAGDVAITATFSEPIYATPNIAIDQPGDTDIAAAAMALPSGGDRTIWTYTYTINAAADGTATTTITSAPDYNNNALGAVTGNTFTIDTTSPTPAISNLAAPSSTLSTIDLTWTPTYAAGDFSTYKIYYRSQSGVTSSNGTLASASGSSTASYTFTGLTAGTAYYFVIYICDLAGNCSSASNEADRQTSPNGAVIIIQPSSGGGGSGASAPSIASSAKTFDSTGGTLTTTVGTISATVSVPANTVSGNIAVAEATGAEKQAASLPAAQGTIIGNTVFDIQLSGASNPIFANPITLEFAYDPAQLGAINPNFLNISYFDISLNKWVSLPSTVNATTYKVTAQTTHFTLFAITTVPYIGTPDSNQATSTPEAATLPTADTSGQILGSSVGVYPNGSLLKAPNSPAVWHISGDLKHVIPSAAVFNTRFNWADIVYLPSDKQLSLYETGAAVKFAPNSLVKEQGVPDVYRVSITGDLQGIVSMDVFLKRAYKVSDIIEVEPNGLAAYSRAAYISGVNFVYTGELVSVPQKTGLASVYYIEGGQAREFKTRDIFDRHGLKLKNVRVITASQLKTFPAGGAMDYPDGTLLQGKGTAVYIVSDGKKRAIKSGKDLDALLYNRKRIKVISDTDLNKLPTGVEIKII